jgi:hypothetical protein
MKNLIALITMSLVLISCGKNDDLSGSAFKTPEELYSYLVTRGPINIEDLSVQYQSKSVSLTLNGASYLDLVLKTVVDNQDGTMSINQQTVRMNILSKITGVGSTLNLSGTDLTCEINGYSCSTTEITSTVTDCMNSNQSSQITSMQVILDESTDKVSVIVGGNTFNE